MKCAECKFFTKPHPDWKIEDMGACQRFPPVPIGGEDGVIHVWPTVAANEWCGEFLMRDELVEKAIEESRKRA